MVCEEIRQPDCTADPVLRCHQSLSVKLQRHFLLRREHGPSHHESAKRRSQELPKGFHIRFSPGNSLSLFIISTVAQFQEKLEVNEILKGEQAEILQSSQELNIPASSTPRRIAFYRFKSDHPTYPSATYCGCWENGKVTVIDLPHSNIKLIVNWRFAELLVILWLLFLSRLFIRRCVDMASFRWAMAITVATGRTICTKVRVFCSAPITATKARGHLEWYAED